MTPGSSRWRDHDAGCEDRCRAEEVSVPMVEVGNRIRLSSTKGPDREGVVTAVTGSLLRVRWPSEEETTVIPAPGTLTVLAAGKVAPRAATSKGAAKKPARPKAKKASKGGATDKKKR